VLTVHGMIHTQHEIYSMFFISRFSVWSSVLLFQMCQWAGVQRTGGAVTTSVRRWMASLDAHAIRASDCMEQSHVWVSNKLSLLTGPF
jgi:hypothetical protein